MKYGYFLIDLDHTLFDFERAEEEAFRAVMKRRGIEYTLERFKRYQKINSHYWEKLSKGTVTKERLLVARFEDFALKENLPLNAEETNRDYLDYLSTTGYLIDGALETVKALHEKGKIAIVTNGASRAQHGKIRNMGIVPYVDALIISEEVGCEKPFPGIFETALAALQCPDRGRAIMIGDAPVSDIEGAQNAGIDTLLFDPAGRYATVRATYRVQHLADIVPTLEMNHEA